MCQELEFRVFVSKNQVTAICQYDHYTYYPRLNNMKGQVQERILQAWQCVHDLVGEESYVVDFFYSPTKDKATLIELSPFLEVAGQ